MGRAKTVKIDRSGYLFNNRVLLALIIPLVIEQTLNLTAGLVDSIIVAAVGEAAVSGVSLMDTIYMLVLNIFSALSTGGAVIAGQYLGQKNRDNAKKAATELFWVMMVLSTALTILMYLLKPFILNVVFGQIDADVYSNAEMYLMVVNLSIPFMGMYNASAAIFRSVGNSKVVMTASLTMAIFNVVGNMIGVYVLNAGMYGVAVPTLLSRVIGGVMLMLMALRKNQELSIEPTFKHHFDLSMIKRILRIGVPNGFENGMFQLGKIMLVSLVSTFGTISITANAVSQTIVGIQVIPGIAISMALTTVIARCVGANDFEQAKYYNRKLMVITYIVMFFTNTLIYLALPQILNIYNLSSQTAELATQILLVHTLGAILIWPIGFDLPSTFRAAGDVKYTMIISIVAMWAFRIVGGYVCALGLGMGVLGVWVAMMFDWAFRAICHTIRYFSGKWQNKKVI